MKYLLSLGLLLLQLSLYSQEADSSNVLNFAVVETIPVAPGCDSLEDASLDDYHSCFQQYVLGHVARNFKYPKEASKQRVGARIYISFVIERDASVSNIELVRSARSQYGGKGRKKKAAAKALDKEAIRVVESLQFEEPAMQRGKPVRIQYTLPINAKLQ